MQAISTRFYGPTNTKGARIKASAPNGQYLWRSYNYEGTDDQRHADAARALADKMNWPGELIGGHTKDGMCWVWLKDASPRTTSPADGKPRG